MRPLQRTRLLRSSIAVLVATFVACGGTRGDLLDLPGHSLGPCSREYVHRIDESVDTTELVPWLMAMGDGATRPEASGLGILAAAPALPDAAAAWDSVQVAMIRDQMTLAEAECDRDAAFWVRAQAGFEDRMGPVLQGSVDATTNGDPHLETFDGLRYDFQAAGEFVLVSSTEDDLQIQIRQEPLSGSRTVSVNTAIAADVEGDRVGVYAGEERIGVFVDGILEEVPPTGTSLPSGGRIETGEQGAFVIRWLDGSELRILQRSDRLDAVVALVDERAGEVAGLLGDADGSAENDLTPRGEAPLEVRHADFEQLHRSFGDSWRIDDAGSLFDYLPGGGTATFSDVTFPDRPVTLNDLDPGDRRRASGVCEAAGLLAEPYRSACIYDVVVTGEDSFAEQTATVLQLETVTVSPVNVTTFDGLSYDLETPGSYVLVEAPGGGFEVQATIGVDADATSVRLVYSGFAIDVAGDVVEIRAGTAEVIVGGEPRTIPDAGLDLGGGGSVTASGTSFTIAWADGSSIQLSAQDAAGYDASFSLAAERTGAVSGLFGDADGNPRNDFMTPAGREIHPWGGPPDVFRAHVDLDFASSWRVAPEASLFVDPDA